MSQPKGFSILIVDDDPENIALLRLLLENRGHSIDFADSGEEALVKAENKTPDLILLDVMLPGLNGFEVCRRLKKNPQLQSVPVLFLTAKDSREERLAGFQAGAEDYITKPFFKEEVLARVKLWAERAATFKALQLLQQELSTANLQLEERVRERTAALEAAHQKMMIQEKMASMGKLSAGLAHELNNPINFLRNNFSALETTFGDLKPLIDLYRVRNTQANNGDGLRKFILQKEEEIQLDAILEDLDNLFGESREGFDRIAWLIGSMRGFARKEDHQPHGPVDLHKCIHETLALAKNEIRPHAEVTLDLGEMPKVSAHEQKLKQVILNLVINAAQAIGESGAAKKGRIHLRTLVEKDQAILEVQDNGPGIHGETADKVFDPFFTTKDVGKGMGLGLSLCYDIVVQHHGGMLEFKPSDLGGACFRMTLPLNQALID